MSFSKYGLDEMIASRKAEDAKALAAAIEATKTDVTAAEAKLAIARAPITAVEERQKEIEKYAWFLPNFEREIVSCSVAGDVLFMSIKGLCHCCSEKPWDRVTDSRDYAHRRGEFEPFIRFLVALYGAKRMVWRSMGGEKMYVTDLETFVSKHDNHHLPNIPGLLEIEGCDMAK